MNGVIGDHRRQDRAGSSLPTVDPMIAVPADLIRHDHRGKVPGRGVGIGIDPIIRAPGPRPRQGIVEKVQPGIITCRAVLQIDPRTRSAHRVPGNLQGIRIRRLTRSGGGMDPVGPAVHNRVPPHGHGKDVIPIRPIEIDPVVLAAGDLVPRDHGRGGPIMPGVIDIDPVIAGIGDDILIHEQILGAARPRLGIDPHAGRQIMDPAVGNIQIQTGARVMGVGMHPVRAVIVDIIVIQCRRKHAASRNLDIDPLAQTLTDRAVGDG